MKNAVVAAVLVVLLAPAAAWPGGTPPNDCGDGYWADTLRCIENPGATPQPQPPPPSSVADIRDYTRVDLDQDPGVRCVDGTRPILYVDPSEGGAATEDNWLISFQGGGSCSAEDSDDDGTYDDGQVCYDTYQDEANEMGTAGKGAMTYIGTTSGRSEGIHSASRVRNPVFSRFNRIRVVKCSYDRYNGRATHNDVQAQTTERGAVTYDLFNHGRRIVELAMSALRGDAATDEGLSYQTWLNNGGSVQQVTRTLPALENADRVLLVGHSGAAHGLMYNADFIAAELNAWGQFDGDVRAVIDANYFEMIENETAFDPGGGGDLYDHVWSGTSPEVGPYDGAAYYADSLLVDQYDAWFENPGDSLATIFDASCVATHEPMGEEWMCRDRFHTIHNHMTTPFFIREDISDPNLEHVWGGRGHLTRWGQWGNFPHCADLGINPCPPVVRVDSPPEHRLRLTAQARTLVDDITTRSELALGIDNSGAVPTHAVWMPDCASHSGAYNDLHFYGIGLDDSEENITMQEFLEGFVMAPRVGISASRIEGVDGAISVCSDLIHGNGFEQ